MPRTQISRTPPFVPIHPAELRPRDCKIVLENLRFERRTIKPRRILGKKRDPKDAAIGRVEIALSRYFGLSAVAKDLPNQASLAVELRAFVKTRDDNTAAFEQLHPWLGDYFRSRGIEAPISQLDSAKIDSASTEILEMLDGEHRGRPKDAAFIGLLKDLRRIFRGSYNKEGGSGNRLELTQVGTDGEYEIEPLRSGYTRRQSTKRGAKRMIAQAEKAAARGELEFIRAVLKIADIPCPKNLADRLKTIGHPPQNRLEHLNRIAEAVAIQRADSAKSTAQ